MSYIQRYKTGVFLLFFMTLFVSCSDSPSIEIIEPSTDHNSSAHSYGEMEVTVNSDETDSILIVGRITPPDATLSISYGGECGKSYYRDIETSEGIFTQRIPTSFIREIELFVYEPKKGEASKYVYLKNSGKLNKGDECDYMHVRRYDENRATAYVIDQSCYEIGVKYGACVSRSHLSIPCKPGTDISIPFRCRDLSETKEGIDAGRL